MSKGANKYNLGELLYFAHKELGFSPKNLPLSGAALVVYKNASKGYTKKLDHHAVHLAQMFDKYERDGCEFRINENKQLEVFKVKTDLYNPTIIREKNGI